MCMFDSCMCLGVCASLVVWSLTLLLDDTVSDSLLALVLAWGTGSSPGVKVSDIQQLQPGRRPMEFAPRIMIIAPVGMAETRV